MFYVWVKRNKNETYFETLISKIVQMFLWIQLTTMMRPLQPYNLKALSYNWSLSLPLKISWLQIRNMINLSNKYFSEWYGTTDSREWFELAQFLLIRAWVTYKKCKVSSTMKQWKSAAWFWVHYLNIKYFYMNKLQLTLNTSAKMLWAGELHNVWIINFYYLY